MFPCLFLAKKFTILYVHEKHVNTVTAVTIGVGFKPGLIKSAHSVGLPGISDHCAVVTKLDIDPPYRRTKPRPCSASVQRKTVKTEI